MSIDTRIIKQLYTKVYTVYSTHTELSIDLLKRETQITDEWLDQRLEEADLPEVAACFDNTEDYVEKLGLTPGQQTDVKTQAFVNGNQAGMKVALKHWRNRNPVEAMFRALLLILLSLLKGDVAVRVCKYLSDKCELMFLADEMFYHRC